MIHCLFRAFSSLGDSHFWKILVISACINVFILVSLFYGIWVVTGATEILSGGAAFYDSILDWILRFLAVVFAVISFPLILTIIISFFQESIVKKTIGIYYPDQLPVKEQNNVTIFFRDIRFLLIALLLNCLALVVSWIPLVNIVVYMGLNGFLLGREYFYIVSNLLFSDHDIVAFKEKNSAKLIFAGIIVFFLLTLPIINLIVPLISVVFMVHIIEKYK